MHVVFADIKSGNVFSKKRACNFQGHVIKITYIWQKSRGGRWIRTRDGRYIGGLLQPHFQIVHVSSTRHFIADGVHIVQVLQI